MGIDQEIRRKYGPGVAAGFTSSGGNKNAVRQLNTFLKKRNLPGQVITNAFAQRVERDPQTQVNQALAQGTPITPQQANQTKEQALQMVMGATGPKQFPRPLNLFGRSARPKAIPKLPQIDPETQREMMNFIDYSRLKRPQDLNMELGATRIAEHYGLKMPKKLGGLANVFDDTLSRIRQARK